MKTINLKVFFIALVIMFFIALNVVAQVGIGTINPNTSSILDITSSNKGFLPPRMDTTARDGIITPATGLLIYNIDTNKLNYHNGTSWQVVENGTGSYVDLTTNQSNIAGNKTFTGTITPQGRLMVPMGELSYFNISTPSLLLSAGTTGASGNDGMTKVNPASGVNFLNDSFDSNFSNSTSGTPTQAVTNSKLTYRGATTRLFHIALSFSFTPGANADIFVFGVAKNGNVQDKSKIIIKSGSNTDNQSSAMHVALWLAKDEYIEFYVGKVGGSGSIFVKSFNFFAMGM